jgi:hypothetical protein
LEKSDRFLISELDEYPDSEDLIYFLALTSAGCYIDGTRRSYPDKDHPVGAGFVAVYTFDDTSLHLSLHHPSFSPHMTSFLHSERAGKYCISSKIYAQVTVRHIKDFLKSSQNHRSVI